LQELPSALSYPNGKNISTEKKRDYSKMEPVIPTYAWPFYEELISRESADYNDDVDGYNSNDIFDK
jgi:hypothetical protein